jgi:predicted DNA-binding protein
MNHNEILSYLSNGGDICENPHLLFSDQLYRRVEKAAFKEQKTPRQFVREAVESALRPKKVQETGPDGGPLKITITPYRGREARKKILGGLTLPALLELDDRISKLEKRAGQTQGETPDV